MTLDAIRGEVRDLIGTQYRDAAEESASQAGTSEANAEVSETNAKVSETAAKASQAAAKTSQTAAKTSETNSKASETAAKSAETAAKASETNAKTSETKAKTSETNSKASETKAKTSETNAEESENISLEASAASILAATMSTGNYIGTGFPNGVVTAPVGSIYTDQAATNGAIRWIKTSRTDSYGWEVEYGDTGRRDMSSVFTDSIELGNALHEITLSRKNSTVNLVVLAKAKNFTGIPYITPDLPQGFRLEGYGYGIAGVATNAGTLVAVGNNNSRYRISLSGPGSTLTPGASVAMRLSWPTRDPWPTTLPGTPA